METLNTYAVQTILSQLFLKKWMICFRIFSRLEIGNFPQKIGKKDTFWHWDYNRITAIKSAKNKPCNGLENICNFTFFLTFLVDKTLVILSVCICMPFLVCLHVSLFSSHFVVCINVQPCLSLLAAHLCDKLQNLMHWHILYVAQNLEHYFSYCMHVPKGLFLPCNYNKGPGAS